jgi:septum formation topological specificity factor MinE
MAFYDIFRRKQSSAAVAKDRLQIIVARERRGASGGQAG